MVLYRSRWLIVSTKRVIENGALLVRGKRVVRILNAAEADLFQDSTPSLDVRHHFLISPGFVNAHMHSYGILSHGIPVNVEIRDFKDFLEKFWWPFMEDRIRQSHVLVTTRASAAEMIESGITGFCDTLEAPMTEEGTLIAQAGVIEEIGMRAILSLESCERIDEANGLACLDENERLIRWAGENSSLVSGAICTHTSFTCSLGFLKEAEDRAAKLDSPWQFHLSESRYEPDFTMEQYGKRAVHHYEDNGLLSDNVIASQCVKVDSGEIGILKARGVRPVHMPMSNCEVGGGFSPVPEMLKEGILVAIGTDGYDNDFIRTMQMAFLIHKAALEDPSIMPAELVFRMATENGARVLGWDDCGTLDEGNFADFVCMENRFPTPVRRENLFDQIVVFGKKEYISHVYCNGKPLMEDHRLITIDRERADKELQEQTSAFWDDV